MDRVRGEVIEIPIFPLPGVVLFPGTQLPLHIFEPRYLKMLADALSGPRQIGMVLARRGQGDQEEFCDLGVLGTIAGVWESDDGNYDIVLSGVERFRVLHYTHDEPYRRARVELVGEEYESREDDGEFGEELVRIIGRLVDQDDFPHSVLQDAAFPTIVNWTCAMLQIRPEEKQILLELDQVRERAEVAYSVARQLLSHREFVDSFAHLRPEDCRLN